MFGLLVSVFLRLLSRVVFVPVPIFHVVCFIVAYANFSRSLSLCFSPPSVKNGTHTKREKPIKPTLKVIKRPLCFSVLRSHVPPQVLKAALTE